MSVKRLVPLHAVALDTDPSGARIGDIYYNTTDEELRYLMAPIGIQLEREQLQDY